MNNLILFPMERLEPEDISKILSSIKNKLLNFDKTLFFVHKENLEYYSNFIQNIGNLITLNINTLPFEVENCFLIIDEKNHVLILQRCKIKNLFLVNRWGAITLKNRDINQEDYPFINTHIFNKISSKKDTGFFYYFPYGYLFRYLGVGPINEFGHRINISFNNLDKRPNNHIIIAFFGGSACWSIYSQFTDMFTFKLEQKLNDYCQKNTIDLKFSVLNFGQHGNVILNEVFTYILWGQKIKPDIVIAHDGFNDLAYGQMSDKYLLKNYDITYQNNLEEWGEILCASTDDYRKENGEKSINSNGLSFLLNNEKRANLPSEIIQSCYSRIMQFKHLVECSGGIFISSLQPMIFSKKELSELERIWLPQYKPKDDPYKKMPFLYEKYEDIMTKENINYFINFHKYFHEFGGDRTLFGDVMHTTPEGDEVIADYYFSYLTKKIVPSILNKNINTK